MGLKCALLLVALCVACSLALLGVGGYWLWWLEPPALAEEALKEQAALFYLATDPAAEDGYVDQPLAGKVVVVTGATSGLGASFAYNFYKMGGTVVVTSRSQERSEQTVADFKLDFPFSEGVLHARALDLSDFDSIHEFSIWFKHHFKQLHILVNNAGINYAMQDIKPSPTHPLRSKQGYDLQFASNYLGHFLLTELLLPLLRTTPQARVLQVSSNSHYFPSGADLSTSGGRLIPRAAEVIPQRNSTERDARWQASYGNSKLAQVMHAIELQKILDPDPSTDLKVFSFSPGLTYTGMVPDRAPPLVKSLLRRLFFSPDAAIYAPLSAIFSNSLRGGDEYWNNSPVPGFLANPQSGLLSIDKWLLAVARDNRGGVIPKTLLFIGNAIHQQVYYGQLTVSAVNSVCADTELTEGLYRWSLEEVHRYISDFPQQDVLSQHFLEVESEVIDEELMIPPVESVEEDNEFNGTPREEL